jgi:hypothetical protein
MQLFRQQAIDHQHRLYGEVLLVQPLRWQVIGLLVLGLITTAALFLTLGTYSRTIMVSGVIRQVGLVELQVPSAAIAQIAPGQEVRITLSDYSAQDYGSLRAVIEPVASAPIGNAGAYVPVRARLDPLTARQSERGLALAPGLALNGRIVLAQRSLLEGLLDPAVAAPPR